MIILVPVDENNEPIDESLIEPLGIPYGSRHFEKLSSLMDEASQAAEDQKDYLWKKLRFVALEVFGSPFPGVGVDVYLAGPPCDENGVLLDS